MLSVALSHSASRSRITDSSGLFNTRMVPLDTHKLLSKSSDARTPNGADVRHAPECLLFIVKQDVLHRSQLCPLPYAAEFLGGQWQLVNGRPQQLFIDTRIRQLGPTPHAKALVLRNTRSATGSAGWQ